MTVDAERQASEWSVPGRRTLIRATIAVGVLGTVVITVDWWRELSGPIAAELVWLAFRLVWWGWMAIIVPAVTMRTRVRLVPDGIEVREESTTVYPYAEIADVRRNRFEDGRSITLQLRGGGVVLLPLPVVKKVTDEPVVAAALDSIERRVRASRGAGPLPG